MKNKSEKSTGAKNALRILSKSLAGENTLDIIVSAAAVLAVLCAMWMFTGQWFFKSQPYNSYVLQAQSWLEGRLDLGRDYPYLELAIFNGKYYVSFPPFPSYLMLPFAALGFDSCDGLIALISSLAAVVYAVKIMHECGLKGAKAVLMTLLLTIGSNWLFLSQNAWVWFIAQNLAFTLSLMAIYYAMRGKAGLSLAFWGCAVGCRPFQIIYIPALAYLLYKRFKADNPSVALKEIAASKWKCLIPVSIIALSYMILNFARFGNITEFGHNYLPEFMRVETGQFDLSYMKENIANLFRLPAYKDGKFEFPMANGFNIFMSSPIFFVFVIILICSFFRRKECDFVFVLGIAMLAVIHLLAITAHKTMGGAHFGNRYPCDALPFIFAAIGLSIPKESRYIKLCMIPLTFGFALNAAGTVLSFVK